MKMERLIGILSILLQREKVTAPELAEHFEVSRRTIQRDIESLSPYVGPGFLFSPLRARAVEFPSWRATG